MIEIEKPRISVQEVSDDETYGKFVFEPLERGFGSTLGNSLRRVLLSSLVGAAPTSVRIDGVMHEFTTIPGVKEDVAEIILNIKGIVSKLLNCSEKTVELTANGEGVLTAGMIKCDSDIEIVNKNHHIVTCNEDAKFSMEITFKTGRGYVSVEKNKRTMQSNILGVLPIDSIYTPVTKVNYTIENTRVGQVIDYDKLLLEVWTNGIITAQEAVSQASRILISHFELFVKFAKGEVDDEKIFVKTVEDPEDKNSDISIDDLELSVRAYNCLKRSGINSIQDLTSRTRAEMEKVRNLGKKSLEEVLKKVDEMGLKFREEIE